eukprot:TRINITY_DN56887_c0_g1_i1.p1 TRINITY_DN56887_c0_g1~~TRINITY_DN56887_c0_g1_i1.p1  ORF type:complete len:932 (+),score=178.70 TRINITY_DN56887_c0_g1_i1:334-3129(+)
MLRSSQTLLHFRRVVSKLHLQPPTPALPVRHLHIAMGSRKTARPRGEMIVFARDAARFALSDSRDLRLGLQLLQSCAGRGNLASVTFFTKVARLLVAPPPDGAFSLTAAELSVAINDFGRVVAKRELRDRDVLGPLFDVFADAVMRLYAADSTGRRPFRSDPNPLFAVSATPEEASGHEHLNTIADAVGMPAEGENSASRGRFEFSDSEVLAIVTGFAKVFRTDSEIYLMAVEHLLTHAERASGWFVSGLVQAFAWVGRNDPRLFDFAAFLVARYAAPPDEPGGEAVVHEGLFSPQEAARVAHAFALTGRRGTDIDHALYRAVVRHVRGQLQFLPSYEVVSLLWSLTSAGVYQSDIFDEGVAAVTSRLEDLTPHLAVKFVWAVAQAGRSDPQVFDAVAPYTVHLAAILSPEDLATYIWAWAKAGRKDPLVFDRLLTSFSRHAAGLSDDHLVDVLWAFATAGRSDPALFRLTAGILLRRGHSVPAPNLAVAMWALAKLGSGGTPDEARSFARLSRTLASKLQLQAMTVATIEQARGQKRHNRALIHGMMPSAALERTDILARCLWALTRVAERLSVHTTPPTGDEGHVQWTGASERMGGMEPIEDNMYSVVVVMLPPFISTTSPVDLAMLLWSFSALAPRPAVTAFARLAPRVASVLRSSAPHSPAQALIFTLEAFVRGGLNHALPSDLRDVVALAASDRMGTFAEEEVMEVVRINALLEGPYDCIFDAVVKRVMLKSSTPARARQATSPVLRPFSREHLDELKAIFAFASISDRFPPSDDIPVAASAEAAPDVQSTETGVRQVLDDEGLVDWSDADADAFGTQKFKVQGKESPSHAEVLQLNPDEEFDEFDAVKPGSGPAKDSTSLGVVGREAADAASGKTSVLTDDQLADLLGDGTTGKGAETDDLWGDGDDLFGEESGSSADGTEAWSF